MRSMVDDVTFLCLVRECRELEEGFGTHITEEILNGRADEVQMKEVRKLIGQLDKEKRYERCAEKAPLILEVAERVGWLKLWDTALDLGQRHTRGLQVLSRLMSHHAYGRGLKPCPMCDETNLDTPIFDHILCDHGGKLQQDLSPGQQLTKIVGQDIDFLYRFWNVYHFFQLSTPCLLLSSLCIICIPCSLLGETNKPLTFDLKQIGSVHQCSVSVSQSVIKILG